MTHPRFDVPLTVVGGRGPHGLALHLWMQDRGLRDYLLVDHAEPFDLILAATGVSPTLRDLAILADAAKHARAPIAVGKPARGRPLLDDHGGWKNLPPLYPMGAHALLRAGFAANTLASATVYLPLCLPGILVRAGLRT